MKPKHFYYYKYLESKYTLLVIALLMLICITPFIEGLYITQFLTTIWYNVIILLAIIALRDKKHNVIAFLVLGILNVVASTADIFYDYTWLSIIKHSLYVIFGFSATVAILSEIASTKYITVDTLFGALSTYLLIGIAFGTLYILIELLSPGSFVYSATQRPVTEEYEFYYYSFITLTTVGYGDIVLINIQAKPVVILESITGIFYLATLVARLVSSRKI